MVIAKTIKYLGKKLTKEVEDLYTEYDKALMREIEDTNKFLKITCSWIRRINIVKILILPQTIHRFNAITIKIPVVLFTERKQGKQSKICMGPRKTLNSQNNTEKEKQS